MSRPIKLRAWTGDKFIYLEIAHGGQGKGGIKLDPGVYGHLEPWQQFTGLTDKNGKEIYEGDIVRLWDEDSYPNSEELKAEDGSVYQVLWTGGSAGFWLYEHLGKVAEFEWNPLTGGYWIEVIGNIHENPELLEEHHG